MPREPMPIDPLEWLLGLLSRFIRWMLPGRVGLAVARIAVVTAVVVLACFWVVRVGVAISGLSSRL